MNTVVLITGSNLGNKLANLSQAEAQIISLPAAVVKKSSVYETQPWGFDDQPSFFNQVLMIETELPAENLMNELLRVEKIMGRIRTSKNAPRLIDIDILFYNDRIIKTEQLEIPHKEIINRKFVLEPLVEILPDFVHPVYQLTVQQLLKECKDSLQVSPLKQ